MWIMITLKIKNNQDSPSLFKIDIWKNHRGIQSDPLNLLGLINWLLEDFRHQVFFSYHQFQTYSNIILPFLISKICSMGLKTFTISAWSSFFVLRYSQFLQYILILFVDWKAAFSSPGSKILFPATLPSVVQIRHSKWNR